jgi:GNAT superfamily N-acetyltransferase
MAEPLPIRPARPADRAEVERIIQDAYRGFIADIGREPAPMTADYGALIDRGVVSVIAGADGRMTGVLIDYPLEDCWFLETVAIDPGSQGQGLGRRIVDEVDARARAAGKRVVRLYTNVKMAGNLVFYPKLGYRETGRVTEAGFSRVYFEKEVG